MQRSDGLLGVCNFCGCNASYDHIRAMYAWGDKAVCDGCLQQLFWLLDHIENEIKKEIYSKKKL